MESVEIGAHQQLHALLILQEALTNVMKHARASHVSVRAVVEGPVLRFEIRDNGCGFERSEAKHIGRGLGNMQVRARRIGADLQVDSGAQGTTLTMLLPQEVELPRSAA